MIDEALDRSTHLLCSIDRRSLRKFAKGFSSFLQDKAALSDTVCPAAPIFRIAELEACAAVAAINSVQGILPLRFLEYDDSCPVASVNLPSEEVKTGLVRHSILVQY